MNNFDWKIKKTLSQSRARAGIITTPHGKNDTPAFILDFAQVLEKRQYKIVFSLKFFQRGLSRSETTPVLEI